MEAGDLNKELDLGVKKVSLYEDEMEAFGNEFFADYYYDEF